MVFQELSKKFSCIHNEISLSHYCSIKVGGPALAMAEPTSQEELVKIFKFAHDNKIPFFILGFGSNVIPDDRGFKGLVINTRKVDVHPKQLSPTLIEVSCGAYLPRVVNFCQKQGLSGLEWAIGIPGTVGGSVWMNAGAGGEAISSIAENITIYDGQKETVLQKSEIQWGYRYSEFQENRNLLILSARFRLVSSSSLRVKHKIAERLQLIKEKQPRSYPSVGTVFKSNPQYLSILGAGLKVGGMECSSQNPAWIINVNNGCSMDMHRLIKKILWRHIWRGLPLPSIEPIFIPFDPLTDTSEFNLFCNPPFMIRSYYKIVQIWNYYLKRIFGLKTPRAQLDV